MANVTNTIQISQLKLIAWTVANMRDYGVGRDRMKMKESTLTAVEMKSFRGLLQWLQAAK